MGKIMNIKTDWDNSEKTIIRYQFARGWSWNELHDAFEMGNAMIDMVDHHVNVIMDFSQASMFAPSGALNQARHVTESPRHPNLGLTAVVGSSFISSIFHMITKIAGDAAKKWDIQFVNSLPKAYEAIEIYETRKGS